MSSSEPNLGGWSFFQAKIDNNSHTTAEILGDDTSAVVPENKKISTENNSQKKQQVSSSSSKKNDEECSSSSFPAPLSSSAVLHIVPHRKGGRLILQAVPIHEEEEDKAVEKWNLVMN